VGRARLRRLLDDHDRDQVVHLARPVVGEEADGRRAVTIERLREDGRRPETACEDRHAHPGSHRSAPSLRYGTRITPPASTIPTTSRFDVTFRARTVSPRRASSFACPWVMMRNPS